MWTIFKVFIELVTIWFLFFVLVFWLRDMWDLSPHVFNQTRIELAPPSLEGQVFTGASGKSQSILISLSLCFFFLF